MPMQNAALEILLFRRPRNLELYLPKTQDDTITKPLGERWSHHVGRHIVDVKVEKQAAMLNSRLRWMHMLIYAPCTTLIHRISTPVISPRPDKELLCT